METFGTSSSENKIEYIKKHDIFYEDCGTYTWIQLQHLKSKKETTTMGSNSYINHLHDIKKHQPFERFLFLSFLLQASQQENDTTIKRNEIHQ